MSLSVWVSFAWDPLNLVAAAQQGFAEVRHPNAELSFVCFCCCLWWLFPVAALRDGVGKLELTSVWAALILSIV